MNSIALFNEVCQEASIRTTNRYSTSFALGIRSLQRRFRPPIHAIYGFVRFADEIVDTFHTHDQRALLDRFRQDTLQAIDARISLNPILQSFQRAVHAYGIGPELYLTFLDSMAMDLTARSYDRAAFERYILGSAEAVGLMCLRVFCEGDDALYERLRPAAQRLGAAFQKVNFLRDLQDDHTALGRSYFPGIDPKRMGPEDKRTIEQEIRRDMDTALIGIRQLPPGARFGVYLAFIYYRALLRKIQGLPCDRLRSGGRIRVTDRYKFTLLATGYLKHQFGRI
jgi:phytoene synthase